MKLAGHCGSPLPVLFAAIGSGLLAGAGPAGARTPQVPRRPTVYPSRNCPFGRPLLYRKFRKTTLIERSGYSLLYSGLLKVPLWVCQRITRAQLPAAGRVGGKHARAAGLTADPLIPRGHTAGPGDYPRSRYRPVPMAPPEDFVANSRARAEAHYLSNMAPMVAGLRSTAWRGLEEMIRRFIRARGPAFVITGPLFIYRRTRRPGMLSPVPAFIGRNKVSVPTHFYKMVVHRDVGRKWRVIAFVLKNRKQRTPRKWDGHVKSVHWVEARSGVELLPGMGQSWVAEHKIRPNLLLLSVLTARALPVRARPARPAPAPDPGTPGGCRASGGRWSCAPCVLGSKHCPCGCTAGRPLR